MKRLLVAMLMIFLPGTVLAGEEYLTYPTQQEEFPGSGNFPACKGKLALMPSCVVDADTLRIEFRNYRIGGIDTPESRGGTGAKSGAKCDSEKDLGLAAKDFVIKKLNSAILVRVTTFVHPLKKEVARDKYGRVLVRVAADGNDIGESLIKEGLARHYDGGTKSNWCP